MNITRAIITAAAPDQSTLPLQRLVDRGGREKTALQLIVEEVLDAGIEEVCIVICPGRRDAFEQAAGPHVGRLAFVEQDQPRGYGDALFRACDFVQGQPFLHLVSDHLYLSHGEKGCARQLVDVASAESCAVSGVQPTRESKLPYFGTVGGTPVPNRPRLYDITRVVEKPTPTRAEQELIVPGLRAGHYLCLFGMHVLTPAVMDLLGEALADAGQAVGRIAQSVPKGGARGNATSDGLGNPSYGADGLGNPSYGADGIGNPSYAAGHKVSLSAALAALAQRERYLALEVDGTRYNIGVQYGLLIAQLAVALSGQDREQVLAELVELLATQR